MKAECKKLLSPVAVVILLLMLAGRLLTAVLYQPAPAFSVKLYNEIAEQLQGQLSDQKAKWIAQEVSESERIVMEYGIKENHISYSEYEQAKRRAAVLAVYQQKSEAYFAASDYAPEFFSDLPMLGAFRQYESDYFAFAAFLVIALMSWAQEQNKELHGLLLTSVHGRSRLFRRKFCATVLTGGILSLLFTGAYLVLFMWQGAFREAIRPLQSLLPYAGCTLHSSVREYLLLSAFLKALCMAAAGGILVLFCTALHNTSSAVAAVGAVIFFPVIAKELLPDFCLAMSTGVQLFCPIQSDIKLIFAAILQAGVVLLCYVFGLFFWQRRAR